MDKEAAEEVGDDAAIQNAVARRALLLARLASGNPRADPVHIDTCQYALGSVTASVCSNGCQSSKCSLERVKESVC